MLSFIRKHEMYGVEKSKSEMDFTVFSANNTTKLTKTSQVGVCTIIFDSYKVWIWPKNSLWYLVIGWLQNWCGDTFFIFIFFLGFFEILFFVAKQWKTWYMYTRLLEPDQISHTQSMVAKRGLTTHANVHTSIWKSSLKHSTAEFQSNQPFLLQLDIVSYKKKTKKNKNGSEAMRAETRNFLFCCLYLHISVYWF